MKKMVMVMVVVLAMIMSMVVTGCNKGYDRKETCIACKYGFEDARDRGLITWDIHGYYGCNNYDRAKMDRDWYINHNKVCTEIESEYYEGRVVYKFKTMYIAE